MSRRLTGGGSAASPEAKRRGRVRCTRGSGAGPTVTASPDTSTHIFDNLRDNLGSLRALSYFSTLLCRRARPKANRIPCIVSYVDQQKLGNAGPMPVPTVAIRHGQLVLRELIHKLLVGSGFEEHN